MSRNDHKIVPTGDPLLSLSSKVWSLRRADHHATPYTFPLEFHLREITAGPENGDKTLSLKKSIWPGRHA
jgi:hypothetical protein